MTLFMPFFVGIFIVLLVLPNVCYSAEDFWGNELRDGDEVHILNHERKKGEYFSDIHMVRFENGDYEDADDLNIEQE